MILEYQIDIAAFVECDNLDVPSLIDILTNSNQQWKLIEVYPNSDIRLIAKKSIQISVIKEERHYSIFSIKNQTDIFLLIIVHLASGLYLEESARDTRAGNISRLLQKKEQEIFKQDNFKSIIVGDFNLQPYSRGIIGVNEFNATMSQNIAKKISRVVDGETKYFYYNPMWKLMGDNKLVQGTYYNANNFQDKSIYWYCFDEVLIRPYFIDKFNWDFFDIIDRTKDYNFIDNNKINNRQYSDHLPIKFEIL